MWSRLRVVIGLVGACQLTACSSRVEGTDSSTHWLETCDQDSDCGGGLSCECGSCTVRCGSASSCNALPGAMCVTAECDRGVVQVCAPTCTRDAQCGQGTCQDGTCTLASQCVDGACDNADGATPTPSGTNHNSESTTGTDTNGGASTATEPPNTVTSCSAMDVRDNGDECIGPSRSFWDGATCRDAEWCGCEGGDCTAMLDTVEECRSRYATCLEQAPACSARELTLDEENNWSAPAELVFSFSVIGEEPGQYEEDPSSAPLAEFTEAEWLGTSDADADAGEPLRALKFAVDGEPQAFAFDFGGVDWPLPATIAGLEAGTLVELRVVRGAGEPVQLQVREVGGAPLIWFVQSRPNGAEHTWSFDELSARVGAPTCLRVEETCNWLFTINDIVVGYGESEVAVAPHQSRYVSASNAQPVPSYAILNSHAYFGGLSATSGDTCAVAVAREVGFVVWRDDERSDG